jgi:hypothetical protein
MIKITPGIRSAAAVHRNKQRSKRQMEWTRMLQLPDFKLRVEAVRSGLPMEAAFNAPADFIVAWLAANKA